MTLEPPGAVPLDDPLAMTRFSASTSTIRAANVILTDTWASRHARRIVTRPASRRTRPHPATPTYDHEPSPTAEWKATCPLAAPAVLTEIGLRSLPAIPDRPGPRSRSRRQTPGRDKAITPRTSKTASDGEPVENRVTPRFHDTGRTARHAQGAQDDHRSRRNSAQRPPDGQADTSTDLGAELDRSRRGIRPISAKNEGGGRRGRGEAGGGPQRQRKFVT